MAKLQRNFVRGRMNKDLDERLVPPGEYRDAQNIQISTSTGSDVGAVENILGNTKKSGRLSNPDWLPYFDLTNPVCIGSYVDRQNNKIYWFIHSDNGDAIAEYDQATDTIAPVIVDLNGVLRLSSNEIVTGINVLDGMLLYTDGRNEPKKINIAKFKAGSTDFRTHTRVYARDFIESDVTVIKKRPNIAASMERKATVKTGTGVGCGIDTVETDYNFALSGSTLNVPSPIGSSHDLTFTAENDWAVDDIIILEGSKPKEKNLIDEYRVRAKVTAVPAGSPYIYTVEIESISSDMINEILTWTCVLEEDQPMFALKFPRFAYRWKYDDGEYSGFSPFTAPAFIGDSFIYKSSQAHNEGMENNLRYLRLHTFETPPADAVKIDILYKETNSTAVYKVDTIDATATEYEIKSEILGPIIEPNQLLRVWDNVPKSAKSQEVVSNRVVYGNYTQGYDVGDVAITTTLNHISHPSLTNPRASLKSIRNYQIGVVYGDEYGRETPVFTSDTAGAIINKRNSVSVNKIKAEITSAAPSWATYFKYYIKDTGGEYYNLALDRFYAADDGNVWLAFPSAERNKVQVGDFLALKKIHDDDAAVVEDARYKILDISNEAPEDVANKKVSIVTQNISDTISTGDTVLDFQGPNAVENPEFNKAFQAGRFVIITHANGTSDSYEIRDGGAITSNTGTNDVNYRVELKEALGTEIGGVGVSVSRIQVIEYKREPRKVYNGKFFVKIYRDVNFEDYIVDPQFQLSPVYEQQYVANNIDAEILDDASDGITEPSNFAWGEHNFPLSNVPVSGSKSMIISWAPANMDGTTVTTGQTWFDTGIQKGAFIKFDSDPLQTYYQIDTVTTVNVQRLDADGTGSDERIVNKTITFTENVIGWSGSTANDFTFKIYKQTTDWDVLLDQFNIEFSSPNPAIFETIPKEGLDLDIYYEASDAIPIASHGNNIQLTYFNCYSFGNGVESNRIRDDFNAPTIDKGSKASAPLDEPYGEETRKTGLIYSGIFNSLSGVNNLNQFNMAEKITKDIEPIYGGIQKLYARDTSLIAFCEDKVFKMFIDKDAIYNADGNPNLIATNRVLGDASTFAGEYGISQNPESFATYGFRIYFADKARGAVLRLSMDGLTVISDKGMSDYIQDALKLATGSLIGFYDEDTSAYNLSVGNETLSFKEGVDGWPTKFTYVAESGASLNNELYTFKNGEIWEHSNETRSNFYGNQYDSSITLVINDSASSIKNFKTISYEGDAGWEADIETANQSGTVNYWKNIEGIYNGYIKGDAHSWNNSTQSGTLDSKKFSVQGISTLPNPATGSGTFEMVFNNPINISVQLGDDIFYKNSSNNILRIGALGLISADRKNIRVTDEEGIGAPPTAGDYIFAVKDNTLNTSGITGYYSTITMTNTSSAKSELFAVNTEAFISSE
jgi:hypothetical protein